MSNFRRPKHLTTRRMQETRPNPPKEQAKAQRPAREIRWNCPAAAKCGGCQLTRLSYVEQLQWKQQRVAELLDGICEVRPILGMDDPFHYRNKAILSFAPLPHSRRFASGIYAAGSHRLVRSQTACCRTPGSQRFCKRPPKWRRSVTSRRGTRTARPAFCATWSRGAA